MPFCPSEVLPKELSRKKNPELQDDAQFEDFNQVTAFTIVQAIRQLASLTEQASNVFDSTLRNIQEFVRRTSALEPRLLEIENEVSKLNKKRTKVGRSSLKKQISSSSPWRHDERLPTNLFLPQDRPSPVSRFRELHCDPILLHFARYKLYLKEHLSSGSLTGSFESLTSQGSSISLPKYLKNPKAKRATSLNRFSFRRKNQSQECIQFPTVHDKSPDLANKLASIPRPQSCDLLNVDDDSDTPSTPNDRSRDLLESSYPPGGHSKDAEYVPVRFHSLSEPLSSKKSTSSTLSSHDSNSQQNLHHGDGGAIGGRPFSMVDNNSSLSPIASAAALVASSTSCLSTTSSGPSSNIFTTDDQVNGLERGLEGSSGMSSFSRAKKTRPVSLFEGQERREGIKSLQPNIQNSAGLDMSSDCVDSVLDNLPAVAEDDEEIDVDEVVADIYKCLDDVIEADETEENQRSSQKIDEESATNDTPSDECEYKVCGEGDLEIAHGSRGSLRKSLDLLPSRWGPKRLLGGGNQSSDDKVTRNTSFVARSKKSDESHSYNLDLAFGTKGATKKLMSGTSNSNGSTPESSPNLISIPKNNFNGEASVSGTKENGATLAFAETKEEVSESAGLVSSSSNYEDPGTKTNDANDPPRMAQADDGWPDAFYSINSNDNTNSGSLTTTTIPTSNEENIKNEDVVMSNGNITEMTSQSVSVGSSTPKAPENNLGDCTSVGDETMGSNSTLVEEDIQTDMNEFNNNKKPDTPIILPHVTQQSQPKNSSNPTAVASWSGEPPEDRDSQSNAPSEEIHSDPILALRNNQNSTSLHGGLPTPPLFPQLSDPGHYVNHDRVGGALSLNHKENMFTPHVPNMRYHPHHYINHGGAIRMNSDHHAQYPNPYPQQSVHMPDNQMARCGFASHQSYPATFQEPVTEKKNSVSSFLGNSSGGSSKSSKSKKVSRKVTWTDILWKPKSNKDFSGVKQPFANLNPNSDKGTKVKNKGSSGATAGLSIFRRKSKKDPTETIPSSNADQSPSSLEYLTPVAAASIPSNSSPLGTEFDPSKKTSYINLEPGKKHMVATSDQNVPGQEIESNYNTESLSSLYAESVSSSDQGSISPRGNNYANSAATLPGSEYYNGFPEHLSSIMPKGEFDNDIYMTENATTVTTTDLKGNKNLTDDERVDEKSRKSPTYVNGEHINQPGLTYENSYQKQQEARMALAGNSKDNQPLITQLSSEEFIRKQLEEREIAEAEGQDITDSTADSDSRHQKLSNGPDNNGLSQDEVHNVFQDDQNSIKISGGESASDVKPKTIHIDPYLFDQNTNPGQPTASNGDSKTVRKKNRIHFSDVIKRHSADISSDEENLQGDKLEEKRLAKESKLRNFISESLLKKPERSILRRSPSSRNPDRCFFDYYSRDSSRELDSAQNPRRSYTESIDSADSSTSNTNIPFIDDEKGSQANICDSHYQFSQDNFNVDPAILEAIQNGIGIPSRAGFDDDTDLDLIDDSGSETDEDDDDDDELDEDDENDSVVYHSSAAALQMLEVDRIT